MHHDTLILGIETSCDETGIAIYSEEKGILADVLYSQIDNHRQYGGVVPELAARDHLSKTLPLIQQTLLEAKVDMKDIRAIAYTAGPGLVGALLVGASVACSLAYSLQIPAIPINHMEGHLVAPLLEAEKPHFPFLTLLVSGGHTQLIHAKAFGDYEILGDTLDDAVGEAFDKTAKLLGLGYPGGPAVSALAEKGNANRFAFPRPMVNRQGLDFSFSGLKTFTRNLLESTPADDTLHADIAAGFQEAATDTLLIKCKRALKQTELKQLVAAGGVSANRALQQKLNDLMTELGGTLYLPRHAYCTDNGAMIAYAGFLRYQQNTALDYAIHTKARWPLDSL